MNDTPRTNADLSEAQAAYHREKLAPHVAQGQVTGRVYVNARLRPDSRDESRPSANGTERPNR